METATLYSPFNAMQLHLLKMFAHNKREESLLEMKSVLFNHYRKKLKMQTRKFWQENNLDAAKMDEIMYGHNRVSVA